jgi:hypothetical protein
MTVQTWTEEQRERVNRAEAEVDRLRDAADLAAEAWGDALAAVTDAEVEAVLQFATLAQAEEERDKTQDYKGRLWCACGCKRLTAWNVWLERSDGSERVYLLPVVPGHDGQIKGFKPAEEP